MVNELIVFGDAEALAVTWLSSRLDKQVGTKVPDPRPSQCVKVVATGGTRRDLAYREAQLTFECWADNETDAADLAALVDAHMNAAEAETVNDSFIRKVLHVGGPVNSPDPESNSSRYLVTKGVQYRGFTPVEES